MEEGVKLTGIVAMTQNRVIGKDGDLPWHLPEDLKFFKKTTSGHPIVMGRKTYESIGRPLPKRQNIVLTRDREWSAEGVDVIHSPEDIEKLNLDKSEVFIIGGAEIYKLFLNYMDELIITHVKGVYEGDTYFPQFTGIFKAERFLQKRIDFDIILHKKL